MKIGIYGGTFDPPHNGHINACKGFLKAFNMDRLLIIPTSIPPHKIKLTSVTGEQRFDMCTLAFAGLSEKIEISDMELKREGKSYTALTSAELLSEGADEILLLCGTDMLLTFDTWYKFEYIFQNATIVCMRRENEKENDFLLLQKTNEYKEKYNAKIEFIDAPTVEASSTEIRADIDKNYISSLIPSTVYDYIVKNQLYKKEENYEQG